MKHVWNHVALKRRIRLALHMVATVWCILSSYGAECSGVIPDKSPVIRISTSAQLQAALAESSAGMSILLAVDQMDLKETINIDVSDVVVQGLENGTTIRCPYRKSAFAISGTNITLKEITVTDCHHVSAIKVQSSPIEIQGPRTVRFERVNFTENTNSKGGAGLFIEADQFSRISNHVTVTECLFDSNASPEGALHVRNSRLDVQRTVFTSNKGRATGSVIDIMGSWHETGGAIHAFNSSVAITDSLFEKNDGDLGGAIYGKTSDIHISRSRFLSNTAIAIGGAIYIIGDSGSLMLSSTTFERNECQSGSESVIVLGTYTSLQEDIIHAFPIRSSGGGAIGLVGIIELNITSCEFNYNRASTGGAVYMNYTLLEETDPSSQWRSGPMRLENCSLVGNRAERFNDDAGKEETEEGGAIYGFINQRGFSAAIIDSNLDNNRASMGGSMLFYSNDASAVILSQNTSFRNNTALTGGAVVIWGDGKFRVAKTRFTNNTALHGSGGGVLISHGGSFYANTENPSTIPQLIFSDNRAVDGGGIACSSCEEMHIDTYSIFDRNIATRSGGGLYAEDGIVAIIVTKGRFVNNIASNGGGIALYDCMYASIGSSDYVTEFGHNYAITGGGVSILVEHRAGQKYTLKNSKMHSNQAMTFFEAQNHQSSVVKHWMHSCKERRSIEEICRAYCSKCKEGSGGGFILSMDKVQHRVAADIALENVNITSNQAMAGGGGYVEVGRQGWNIHDCNNNLPLLPFNAQCLLWRHSNVAISHNNAEKAAGGLFVDAPFGNFSICETREPLFLNQSAPNSCTRISNNSVNNGGFGANLATEAASLNVLDSVTLIEDLTSGNRLGVKPNHSSPGDIDEVVNPIILEVVDGFGQHITDGINDAELEVVLEANHVFGAHRYKARNGIIAIDDTYVTGVDIKEKMYIRSSDERRISTHIQFATRPCSRGEFTDHKKQRCFRCPYGNYTFHMEESTCRNCEEHAECPGTTTLIPKDGFWHSTPFSPYMKRCLLAEACSRDNRFADLGHFSKDSDMILRALNTLNTTERQSEKVKKLLRDLEKAYQQCGREYEGLLCGSCSKGYARSAEGSCKVCESNRTTEALAAIALLIIMIISIGIKIWLAASASKHGVQWLDMRSRSSSSGHQHTSTQAATSAGQQTGGAGTMQIGAQPAGTTSQATATLAQQQDPLLLANTHHSKLFKDAAETLSQKYNLLFDFVQLSSVALTQDIKWGSALKNLLKIHSLIGRATGVLHFPQLGCIFNRIGKATGLGVFVPFLYKTLLPLFLFSMVCVILQLYRLIKRGYSTSTSNLPSMWLISFVIFTATSIDVFGEWLGVLNCVNIKSHPDHDYAVYDYITVTYVWTKDTSVTCWEGTHLVFAILSAIGLFAFLILVIAIGLVLYEGKKHDKLDQPGFKDKYGVIYSGYRRDTPSCLYWEIVLTIRRLLLAAIGVYVQFNETTNTQMGLFFVVIFASFALHICFKPFKDDGSKDSFPAYAGWLIRRVFGSYNHRLWIDFNKQITFTQLETVSLMLSLFVFGIGMAVNDDKGSVLIIDLLTDVCFAVNLAFVLFMLYHLFFAAHHVLDMKGEELCIVELMPDAPGRANWWFLQKAGYVLYLIFKPNPINSQQSNSIATGRVLDPSTQRHAARVVLSHAITIDS